MFFDEVFFLFFFFSFIRFICCVVLYFCLLCLSRYGKYVQLFYAFSCSKLDCCFWRWRLCIWDEKCAFDSIVSHWLTSTKLIKIRFLILITIIIIKPENSNWISNSFFGTIRLIRPCIWTIFNFYPFCKLLT